jgi:hypothetical protein
MASDAWHATKTPTKPAIPIMELNRSSHRGCVIIRDLQSPAGVGK